MTREDILKLKRSNRELAQRLNLKGRFAEEVEEPKKPSTTISSTQNELTVVENSIISGKGKQFDKAWRDLIHYGDSQSTSSCWKTCQNEESCQWFTHDFANNLCFLFKNCPEIDYNLEVVSGQRDCDYEVVRSK